MTVISIQADRLVKRFPHRVAVDGVSFSVIQGSVFGLLGRNGAGKSSTIKMLTTLSPISSGKQASLASMLHPVRLTFAATSGTCRNCSPLTLT